MISPILRGSVVECAILQCSARACKSLRHYNENVKRVICDYIGSFNYVDDVENFYVMTSAVDTKGSEQLILSIFPRAEIIHQIACRGVY